MLLFQGWTNERASLAALIASLNSPSSEISLNSEESEDGEEEEEEETLLPHPLMLNNFSDKLSLPTSCSSTHPRFETNPPSPTQFMSYVLTGMCPLGPRTSLALSHIFEARQAAPGRNLEAWRVSHRLSWPAKISVNVEAKSSLLEESREEIALFFSWSEILIAVVSVFRRASYGVDLMNWSEKSARNLNFFLRLATSWSLS